jgi:uncharacterized protein with GYD domain
MMFVVTLTHTPELCFANDPYKEKSKRWIENMRESAKKIGVKIHGAYVSPNEHTFYFVLEAENYKAVSDFLCPPMLTHHAGRVSPVIPIEETAGLTFMK